MSALRATHLIVAGPASHNPALLDEMRGLAERLGDRLGCTGSSAAWFDQGRPSLPDALRAAVETGAAAILVLPYLIQWSYPDQFSLPALVRAFAREHPSVQVRLAAPLGLGPAVEHELADRALAALDGPDLTTLSAQDLRTFAFQDPPAVRNPAAPSYPAARHHLLVCGGRPCLDAGATLLEAALREAATAAGQATGPERAQITRTRCLGPCRGASIVTAYPSGDWYHNVAAEDAAGLLETITGRGSSMLDHRFRPA
ncbi:MAG: NAD(P)H-dependent oxidoreductase subunit E [Chloroflexi bacterium]|nr:NAD(P)H-dependent oxidoreductase subunit E [Chloroflexota bacterium]